MGSAWERWDNHLEVTPLILHHFRPIALHLLGTFSLMILAGTDISQTHLNTPTRLGELMRAFHVALLRSLPVERHLPLDSKVVQSLMWMHKILPFQVSPFSPH